MKIFGTILLIPVMILLCIFSIITLLMGIAYVLKVGFKEVFDIEVLNKINAREYFENILKHIRES